MGQKRQNNRLGTEPIVPLLFRLAVPSILSMFIQSLYNVVDSIFVARLSEDALAGLSLAFPVQMVLIAISVGTGVGASSLISRLLGQGREERASNAAEHVLFIAVFYGLVAGAAGMFFSRSMIGAFTDNSALIDYGSRYIKIILAGSTALFIPMIANNILRGEGNTFIPMVTMLIGSVLNIIMDPLLIFGLGPFPRMGVEGAALATVLSRIISGAFIIYMLFKGENQIRLHLKNFRFDPSIVKGIYEVGFPAMTMQILASVMIAGLNRILDGYSATAIAAMGIYFRLQSFVFMPVFGLNQGYMPIIGYNYGHNNPDRMKKAMRFGLIIAFIFTFTGFLVFQIFPTQLIMLFNSSPQLLSIGKNALTRISFAFPVIGPAIIGSTTFQAVGIGIPSLILSFNRQIVLLLPLAYILGKIGGLDLLWYAFPVAELVSAVIMVVWLRKLLRKLFEDMEGRARE